jgi:hypothetical protein
MMPEEKIEDLGRHYRTVLQALRYGLEILAISQSIRQRKGFQS